MERGREGEKKDAVNYRQAALLHQRIPWWFTTNTEKKGYLHVIMNENSVWVDSNIKYFTISTVICNIVQKMQSFGKDIAATLRVEPFCTYITCSFYVFVRRIERPMAMGQCIE